MECPKCKCPQLDTINLSDQLPAHHCGMCQGHWIRAYEYEQWLETLGVEFKQTSIDYDIPLNFTPSDFDVKAALCPRLSQLYEEG
ncbi:MAG: zf-TFIIB domain-containing protein [Synechococcaceae cyanobacterium RL_1_2]|nr:zf-TFIIB domain-containing protein [Synechococcaceae cyanobacterium RL_1_2]